MLYLYKATAALLSPFKSSVKPASSSQNHELRKIWTRSENGRLASSFAPQDAFVRSASSQKGKRKRLDESEQTSSAASKLKIVPVQRKLMSYNAEQFYTTSKGKQIKPVPGILALAKVILDEDPDVIALQEVGDKKMLENFNTNYLKGQYPNVVSIPVPDPNPIRVALMSKATMKVVDSKSHWNEIRQGAKYGGRRDLLEATFQTDTGYRFTVFNGHFKSMKGGEAQTTPIRLREAANTAKILKKRFKAEKDPQIFVTGDLNLRHDTKYGQSVLDALTHIRDDAKEPDLQEVMLKDGKADPTHAGGGTYPDTKLDYTFVTPSMAKRVANTYVAGEIGKDPWRAASDHLPLVTVFEEPVAEAASVAKTIAAPPTPANLASKALKALYMKPPAAKRRRLDLPA